MILPSEWLFLDRDAVFENASARRRAKILYDAVAAEVANAPEFGQDRSSGATGDSSVNAVIDRDSWHVMAEVAESYPRLLVWLTEGQVGNGSLRNVFGLFVAVLRLIPGVRHILRRELFDPARSLAPWRPALYEALLQRQRYERNREARLAPGARRFGITMDIPAGGTPGLSAVSDVAVITQTGTRDVLREKVVRMASGSIGVSGLRGSGKTTLIRDFCAHRYGTPRYLPGDDAEPAPLRGLRFVVDAPQAFDARDFLIYLYTCLCRRVITDARFTLSASRGHLLSRALLPRRTQPRAVVASLAGVGFLLLAAGLVYQAAVGEWPMPPWRDPFFWEVLGAVACLIGFVAALTWRARQALLEAGQITDLPAEAGERLRRLHFQRTDSVSRGGTVAGPFGIGVNVGDSRSLTENVMSLPELIDDYRDFVERVVAALLEAEQEARRERGGRPGGQPGAVQADDPDAVGADVRLIIGIDSMDQIDDTKKACAFLDELTSVFGTPNCVYVLSLKPATLAAVDQRTVPLKTSSGGLFDEMVWVDALTLAEAAKLIDRRVTGMPAAFIALCYVLSGGLPRELLRVARAICAVKESAAPDADPATDAIIDARGIRHIPLSAAVRSVIGDETQALRHRAMASAASLDIGATPSWLKLIDRGDWLQRKATGPHPAGAHWIQALLDEVGHPWADTQAYKSISPATDLCDGLIAGLYFLLTVSEVFMADDPTLVNTLITPRSARAGGPGGPGGPGGDDDWLEAVPPVLSDLASARTALGMNPYLAADHVRTARRALAAYTHDKALTADIRLPFLRRDADGAGILRGG